MWLFLYCSHVAIFVAEYRLQKKPCDAIVDLMSLPNYQFRNESSNCKVFFFLNSISFISLALKLIAILFILLIMNSQLSDLIMCFGGKLQPHSYHFRLCIRMAVWSGNSCRSCLKANKLSATNHFLEPNFRKRNFVTWPADMVVVVTVSFRVKILVLQYSNKSLLSIY